MAELTVLLIILGIIVAVLWLFLPFAVFGIKDRIAEATSELKKLNAAVALLHVGTPGGAVVAPGKPDIDDNVPCGYCSKSIPRSSPVCPYCKAYRE